MTETVSPSTFPREKTHHGALDGTIRFVVVATMAFLTVVDLFAAQALLPTLVVRYGVSPSAMGLAVNACTFGMAAAGLAVALFSRHIDRRAGILLRDRKSTRLNSSHSQISYAVFCLKKKTKNQFNNIRT